ncbi:MAG: hypothetical protein NHB15_03650 [Methanosarcina barkeri]|nr:hypothetical protein [Methanosarcina sp. ERenArc_MAG2]
MEYKRRRVHPYRYRENCCNVENPEVKASPEVKAEQNEKFTPLEAADMNPFCTYCFCS